MSPAAVLAIIRCRSLPGNLPSHSTWSICVILRSENIALSERPSAVVRPGHGAMARSLPGESHPPRWCRTWAIRAYAEVGSLCRIQCELQFGQAGVEPAIAQELSVPTLLDDAAFVQHQYARGALHGGQPVGDDKGRSVLCQARQRLLHGHLAFCIECVGRFIE